MSCISLSYAIWCYFGINILITGNNYEDLTRIQMSITHCNYFKSVLKFSKRSNLFSIHTILRILCELLMSINLFYYTNGTGMTSFRRPWVCLKCVNLYCLLLQKCILKQSMLIVCRFRRRMTKFLNRHLGHHHPRNVHKQND